jgi:hypothetical protein
MAFAGSLVVPWAASRAAPAGQVAQGLGGASAGVLHGGNQALAVANGGCEAHRRRFLTRRSSAWYSFSSKLANHSSTGVASSSARMVVPGPVARSRGIRWAGRVRDWSLAAFLIRSSVPGDTGRFRAQIETAPRRLAVEPRPTHAAATPKSGPRHLATLSVPCFRR